MSFVNVYICVSASFPFGFEGGVRDEETAGALKTISSYIQEDVSVKRFYDIT